MRPFARLVALFQKKDSPMPSKLVYFSEEHFGETDALDILSPKQLDAILSEGWTIVKRSKKTVTSPKGKKVTVEYFELGQEAKTRELAAPRPREDADDYGNEERAVSTRRDTGGELTIGDNASYLGNGTAFGKLIGRTGPQVGSSIAPDVAYGMGVDAAKTGGTKAACPFPEGSGIPRREWFKGFYAGGGEGTEAKAESEPAMKEAYDHGARQAKLPDDVEVTCPYANGTLLYKEWLRGFSENGGTVE